MRHLTREELECGLDEIRLSPRDAGVLEMIVRRPQVNVREVVETGELNLREGLAGDNWSMRGNHRAVGEDTNRDTQITIANSRLIGLLAGDREFWKWAGDQLFIDMDLSSSNLPAGTRVRIGSSVIEITSKPHTGCSKFANRYGSDALQFVNSSDGKELRLRGLYAKVVEPGMIHVGDVVRKV